MQLVNPTKMKIYDTHYDDICKLMFKNTSVYESKKNPYMDP